MWEKFIDYYSLNLWLDYVPTILILAVSVCLGLASFQDLSTFKFDAYLGGVITFASIVLAVSVFACTMLYQNSSETVVQIRQQNSLYLRKNFSSIIFTSLVCAFIPAICFMLYSKFPWAVVIISSMCLTQVFMKGLRAGVWFTTVLFAEENDAYNQLFESPYLDKKK